MAHNRKSSPVSSFNIIPKQQSRVSYVNNSVGFMQFKVNKENTQFIIDNINTDRKIELLRKSNKTGTTSIKIRV